MTTGPDQNPPIDEQLSAWLDDELPRVELDLLVTRLARSRDYQARLARYSLIGSRLRGGPVGSESHELAALKLAGRVRGVLAESAGAPPEPAFRRPDRALPYAMVAGLALVAVLFTMLLAPLRRPVGAPVQASAQAFVAAPAALRKASLSSQRLTSYLVYHGEYSGLLSARVTESHIVSNSPHTVDQFRAVDRSPTQ